MRNKSDMAWHKGNMRKVKGNKRKHGICRTGDLAPHELQHGKLLARSSCGALAASYTMQCATLQIIRYPEKRETMEEHPGTRHVDRVAARKMKHEAHCCLSARYPP